MPTTVPTFFKSDFHGFTWRKIPGKGKFPAAYDWLAEGFADRMDGTALSQFNTTAATAAPKTTINGMVAITSLMLANDGNMNAGYLDGSGVMQISDTVYAAEYHHESGSTTIVEYDSSNGNILACDIAGDDERNLSVLPFGKVNPSGNINCIPFMLAMMPHEIEESSEAGTWFKTLKANLSTLDNANVAAEALFGLSDHMYFGIKEGDIKLLQITSVDSIPLLDKDTIVSGSLTGTLLYGKCKILSKFQQGAKKRTRTVNPFKNSTIGKLKKLPEVMAYTANHCKITEAEKKMIPYYPDTFPVPDEVIEFLRVIVNTADDMRPVVQMMWRGVSGFGKSTGVEILCAILQKPLVKFTCSSTTEKQDFLTQIVPDTSKVVNDIKVSLEDIENDPEGVYEFVTGKYVEGVTPEDAYKVVCDAVRGKQGNSLRYVMQESTYIQALKNGWMVEVQEASRIRDAGVLPGLNEYDRPGARIPQVDGSFAERHRDALVFFTDNIGYNSCNELDPAVLRRFAVVIDSEKLPKDKILERIKMNQDAAIQKASLTNYDLNIMYTAWDKVYNYCAENDLLSAGGSVTSEELERWVQMVGTMGRENILKACRYCVVNKATGDYEEQKTIMSACVSPVLSSFC